MFGSIIRNSPVHVLPSLAATCQSCPVSRKTGRSHYIGSIVLKNPAINTELVRLASYQFAKRISEAKKPLNVVLL
jgi:hypothetical protein